MKRRVSVQSLSIAAAASIALATAAVAQQKPAAAPKPAPQAAAPQKPAPSPAALLMAKEIIEMKGASTTFDPLVAGVINHHRNLLIEINPNLSRPLQEVAEKLLQELAPRRAELQQDLARVYASHFTEQELRDALAFYKTPLGRKLVTEEPKAMDSAFRRADEWSRTFAEEVVQRLRSEMQKRGHNLI
ncbi:MAG: DUF2059 domain-containing protein [Alphaproteobacteria bacterium]|nr:DUF2059 domain-containing protein [Alphaproteobacteria bacterium]